VNDQETEKLALCYKVGKRGRKKILGGATVAVISRIRVSAILVLWIAGN
jgi:hypothetical protein